jgi:ABC-type glutathione transport system ATPase component
MACIEARGLRKTYGRTIALDGVDLRIEPGRIVGLIGPNGAGKTTALNAILGLTSCEGELEVLGLDPRRERGRLMESVSFIADVAILPRWIRVEQILDYVGGVHPRFDREKAEAFLARTRSSDDPCRRRLPDKQLCNDPRPERRDPAVSGGPGSRVHWRAHHGHLARDERIQRGELEAGPRPGSPSSGPTQQSIPRMSGS